MYCGVLPHVARVHFDILTCLLFINKNIHNHAVFLIVAEKNVVKLPFTVEEFIPWLYCSVVTVVLSEKSC